MAAAGRVRQQVQDERAPPPGVVGPGVRAEQGAREMVRLRRLDAGDAQQPPRVVAQPPGGAGAE
ncbi:hypothetical protein ACTIVE_1083, partial [Actinomadura verrucosospora]